MRNKVAKRLRKLTKHLEQETKYNEDYRPITYSYDEETDTITRKAGIPRTLVETSARSVYKRLKGSYVGR